MVCVCVCVCLNMWVALPLTLIIATSTSSVKGIVDPEAAEIVAVERQNHPPTDPGPRRHKFLSPIQALTHSCLRLPLSV